MKNSVSVVSWTSINGVIQKNSKRVSNPPHHNLYGYITETDSDVAMNHLLTVEGFEPVTVEAHRDTAGIGTQTEHTWRLTSYVSSNDDSPDT